MFFLKKLHLCLGQLSILLSITQVQDDLRQLRLKINSKDQGKPLDVQALDNALSKAESSIRVRDAQWRIVTDNININSINIHTDLVQTTVFFNCK